MQCASVDTLSGGGKGGGWLLNSKGDMMDEIKYFGALLLVVLCVWSISKIFADSISDYEVIQPKEGVECVVVSRAFNTSVDCWER